MTPIFHTILLDVQDRVATVTLNRPDARNALNSLMCAELVQAMGVLAAHADVNVVLIQAAGAAFCAGADLKERKTMSTSEMTARRVQGFAAYGAIERLPQPVIAVVQGPAFGSGCEIAAACDFVLASSDAIFCYPEVGWGTVGATQRLPRIAGARKAKELLFTGRRFDAAEASEIGLVNQVHAPDALPREALEMAKKIAGASPLTVRLTKRSIDQGLATTREGAMAIELLAIEENLRGTDWRQAIAGFGASDKRGPRMIAAPITLSQALDRVALERPQAQAFVAPGERHDWRTMREQAQHIARALHAAGVRHGDHVGVLLGNSGVWVQIFYACAMLGAVTVPVNTRFKTEELEFCLKQADVKLLLTADTFLGIDFLALLAQVEPALDHANGLPGERLPSLRQVVVLGERCPPGARSWHDFLAAGNAVDDAQLEACVQAVAPDDVLLIQYTSGTTSFPKGVMLTHANMLTNAWAAAQRIGVNADDRYFSIRPYFHVAGTTLSILVSLVTGCCLLTLPKFEVADALQMLDAERCTLTSGNDTIFLMLMGHPDFDRSRIHLRGGWAAAGPQVMQKIRDVMGVPGMCNAYGQSEASPNITLSSHDDPFALRAAGWALPHPGMEVRVVDPGTGAPVAVGEAGEIQARGWSVMKGYYNMPEATARALGEDGWLSTGDLGEMDAAGRLRMVGRLKDMFRVGGENVAPAEVEEVLHAHPAVRMAQVVGVPDARLGEVPAAFVLLKDGQDCTADELTAWCKQRCANYKVPRHVAVVDSFEHIGMTGSSKVQKNKLRAHAIALFGLEQTA